MWGHLKDSVQTHACGFVRDISGRLAGTEPEASIQPQYPRKDAMKNVVTPNSIPQFTVPPLLPCDPLTAHEESVNLISCSASNEDQKGSSIQARRSDQKSTESSSKRVSVSDAEFPSTAPFSLRRNKGRVIDQQIQPGLSLQHLLSTKSGFSTLTESPNTRRKESLFLAPPLTHLDTSSSLPCGGNRTDESFHVSSSDSDISRTVSPTSSPLIEKLRSRRLLARNNLDSDGNNSSCPASPYASPAEIRKISRKQNSEPSRSIHMEMKQTNSLKHNDIGTIKSRESPTLNRMDNTKRELIQRSHSACSLIHNRIEPNGGSVSLKNPKLHIVLTYLASQHKMNISIIEGENFYVDRAVYLKISLHPSGHGYHRTELIKTTSPSVNIRERFTFEPVKEEDIAHLSLEIFCKEKPGKLRNSVVIGKCINSLSDIDINTANDMWLELEAPNIKETPHIHLSLCYHAMLGIITVEVITVKNIPKGSLGRHQDCYVVLTEEPRHDKSKKKQTKISHRTKDPVFEESFMFSISHENHDKLVIVATLFVKDKVKGHWISKGEVKLGQSVDDMCGRIQWAQALAKEGQPISFWHILSPT